MPMSQTISAAATEAVWREFHERLRAFVSRRVARVADVEDILQEVFLRIHRGIDSIQQRDRLPAWVFQITRNVIIDHYRSGAVHPETASEEIDTSAAVDDDEDLQGLAELSTCMEPMMAALPEAYRDAIRSTELDGLTQGEAARRAGVGLSAMKSRVQRARRRLKTMLEECCRIVVDRRGGIVDYSVRDDAKSPCGAPARQTAECCSSLRSTRSRCR
jgi:RNA polymerase sigma-70 factor (ECF subfamily)